MIKKLLCYAFLSLSAFAFADVKIMNPVPGTWANKQVLMIEASEGESVFYSLSGEDPLESGFAYDGPVFIDLSGEVKITVAAIDNSKKKTAYSVEYTVVEPDYEGLAENQISFVRKVTARPKFDLPCGTILPVPDGVSYSFALDSDTYVENASDLFVSDLNTVDRYSPVALNMPNGQNYRFILHSIPVIQGEYSKREVPFRIVDWSKIEFTDRKMIYSVDGSWWKGWKEEVIIDRNVPHTVQWQNVDYNSSNPIETFVIPASPAIKTVINNDRTVTLSLAGSDDFRIAECENKDKLTTSSVAKGLYKEIVFDCYKGEKYSESFPFDVYYDNVYQGTLIAGITVSKQKPASPVIDYGVSSFSRDNVKVSITTEDDLTVYYYIYPGYSLTIDDVIENNVAKLESIVTKDKEAVYKCLEETTLDVVNDSENAMAYVVTAYAVDKWQNVSDAATEFFIIDRVNFFLGSRVTKAMPDGTVLHPFNNLKDLENIVNDNKFTRIIVLDSSDKISDDIVFKSNVEIAGTNSTSLKFDCDSTLNVENASLCLNTVVLEKDFADECQVNTFINGTTALVDLKDCEIIYNGGKNATALNLSNSVLSVADSGITVNASEYACCISQRNTSSTIKKARLVTVCSTGVNVSCKNGTFNMTESNCQVNGTFGRVAEFFAVKGSVTNCDFTALNLLKNLNTKALWLDEKSSVTQKGNKVKGF